MEDASHRGTAHCGYSAQATRRILLLPQTPGNLRGKIDKGNKVLPLEEWTCRARVQGTVFGMLINLEY